MNRKLSICVFLVVILVFGFGWAKEFHAGIDGEAPLVKLWEQFYSPPGVNFLLDIAIDGNDNIIVTGFTGFFEAVETIKYDGNGEVLWTNKDPSFQIAYAVAVDSLNNIIVGASHPLTGYNIIKYLPDGATDWTKTYDEGGADIVWSVACDGDDNVIVLGDTQPDQGWITLKYNKQGALLWNKPFGYPEGRAGYPQSVAIDSYNNIILAGYGYYNSSSGTDIVIIKYDPEGNMRWSEPVVYDSGNYDYAQAVCIDKDDNIVVAGSRRDGEGNDHLYVRKYGSDGGFIWDVMEDSGTSTAHAVAIDKNNRILVGGTKGEYRNSNYIVCYDTSGNKLWDFACDASPGSDEIYGLAINSNNDIGVGSTATGTYLTTKYAYACEGNFDGDGDVDGSDLTVFAAVFGRTDCVNEPPCHGDFDGDGDIDGSDLAVFVADFGRTDCPGSLKIPYIKGYSNSGCLDMSYGAPEEYPGCGEDEIIARAEGNSVFVAHKNATYNCCPDDIEVTLSSQGNILTLYEKEILITPCDCMCCYNVHTEIAGLIPGEYTIVVCWQDWETHGNLCKTVKVIEP